MLFFENGNAGEDSEITRGLHFMHRNYHCGGISGQIVYLDSGGFKPNQGDFMKTNMGTVDRIIRALVAGLIAVLYFTHQITGTAAIILGALAVVFLLTSLISFCPLYLPLGLSTRKAK